MPTNRHIAKAEADLYATTLIDALNEAGGMDAVLAGRSQLDAILTYDRTHVELHDLLTDVNVTPQQRGALVKQAFSQCEPAVASVLSVMAERGDFGKLPLIRGLFDNLIAQKFNVTVVDVVTRVELDDHLRDVIKRKAGADLGTDIVLNETVDAGLLGGIIMSANGQRIDASVNTLLENARSALKKTN